MPGKRLKTQHHPDATSTCTTTFENAPAGTLTTEDSEDDKVYNAARDVGLDIDAARHRIDTAVSGKIKLAKRRIRDAKIRRKKALARGFMGIQTVRSCDRDIAEAENELEQLSSGVAEMDMHRHMRESVKRIVADTVMTTKDDHAAAVLARTAAKLPEMTLKASVDVKSVDSRRAKRRRPHTSRTVRALHTGTSMSSALGKDEFGEEFLGKERVVYMMRQEVCTSCGGRLVTNEMDVEATCQNCGHMVRMLGEARGTGESYSSGNESQLRSCYKRKNHFMEWLKRLQAKQRMNIEPEVLTRVCEHIRTMGVESSEEMTSHHVLTALQALRLPHLYEHKHLVLTLISHKRPPQLSLEQEELLLSLFLAALPAFHACAPSTRKNFLSYSYCLHQLLLLIGLPGLSAEFVLLKGSDKLHLQDKIWAKMCQQLGWTYNPAC